MNNDFTPALPRLKSHALSFDLFRSKPWSCRWSGGDPL